MFDGRGFIIRENNRIHRLQQVAQMPSHSQHSAEDYN